MSAAAVISIKIRRYIQRFREAGATIPDRALTLPETGCRDSWIFQRLVNQGVFIPAPGGRFWLDEDAARRYLEKRRSRALGMIVVMLVIGLLLYLSGILH